MPAFDLLTEPWIPVLDSRASDSDGGVDLRSTPGAPLHLREVGLREALLRAHEIREVYTDSPLETIALYRLLLALAIDVYQPEPDVDRWQTLWNTGHFAPEPLDVYLQRRDCDQRFDLLHPIHPFYQRATTNASQEGKDPAPLAKLFHAQASGNNATLFGHDIDAEPEPVSLARAARGLVAMQAAALGGGVSKPFNFSHAPLVGRAQFWIRGRSLFEALLLNAPPRDDARMGADEDDAPVWRRTLDEDHEYARRTHEGLLDVLTWPSRRLTLVSAETESGPVATGVYLTQGDKLEPQPGDDPFSAYIRSKKEGIFPLGLRTNRAVWRDAAALFSTLTPDGSGAPQTFRWASSLAQVLPSTYPTLRRVFREEGVDAFGLVNDQAKAELWRHERLPLYVGLLGVREKEVLVRAALEHAEEVARGWKRDRVVWGLRPAIKTTAAYALAPPAPGDDSYPNADPKEVANLAQSLAAEPRYWAALEPAFFTFLANLADAEDQAARDDARSVWSATVEKAATNAFRAATASFDGDARHLRAVAKGQARLHPPVSATS